MDPKPGRPVAPRAERRRLSHVDRTRPTADGRCLRQARDRPAGRRGGDGDDVGRDAEPRHRWRRAEGRRPRRGRAGRRDGRQAHERADPALPPAAADRPPGLDHARTASTSSLRIRAEAATTGQTGVEMEAMTAASVAALTVYDMVKGVERGVTIGGVRLVAKSGGKSGDWVRQEPRGSERCPSSRPGARAAGRIAKSGKPGRSAARASGRDEARPRHHRQRSGQRGRPRGHLRGRRRGAARGAGVHGPARRAAGRARRAQRGPAGVGGVARPHRDDGRHRV